MKRKLIIAFIIGFTMTCGTSCSKESAQQKQDIDTFVTTYFPETTVLSTIKDGLDYEVTLSDYTRIEFDGKLFGKTLEWEEVDCKHSTVYTAVPTALVPTEITNYVSQVHSGLSIVKISKDSLGWDIELSNGIEIEFDKKFRVIEID